jgi:flagellar hook-associated protein 2
MNSIPVALGIGSGIDTAALVSQLVDAQFAQKTRILTTRQETVEAQISGLSQLRNGLAGFSLALSSLVGTGTLSTQPVSADPSVVAASLLPGARLSGLSAEVEVRQLATSQVVTSPLVADRTAPIGTGALTITLGTTEWTGDTPTGFTPKADATPVTVTIADGGNSLAGIAAAINATGAGVTATVVTDVTGSRLSIKSATGADQSFTIDVAEDAGAPGLAMFAWSPTAPIMTLTRKAADAVIAIDGVELRRPGNSFADVVPGVKLDLLQAVPGRAIALTSQPPTAALGQSVEDIVATYNELLGIARAETNPTDGALRGDPGAREMIRRLGTLSNRPLLTDALPGEPRTLAELGVRTSRDGSLSVDPAQLQRALTANPAAVERMITSGLGRALREISTDLTGQGGGLASSQNVYSRQQRQLADEQDRLARSIEDMRTRLTRQFAGMDARVSAYKATQSFLEQQIKSWTADR